MNLCVKISNQLLFKKIEGWTLIQEVGAYSRRRLLDISVSRVGTHSRGHLFERVVNQSTTIGEFF